MYKYLSFEKLPKELIADLEQQPTLLARTAATAVKSFFQITKRITVMLKSTVRSLGEIAEKEVEQTKLALLAEKF